MTNYDLMLATPPHAYSDAEPTFSCAHAGCSRAEWEPEDLTLCDECGDRFCEKHVTRDPLDVDLHLCGGCYAKQYLPLRAEREE